MALSIGAIIGITAGGAVAIIIIIVIAVCCVYQSKDDKPKKSPRIIVDNGQLAVKVPTQNGVQANGHVHKIVYKVDKPNPHVQRPPQRMNLHSFKFEPTALTTREKVGSLTHDLPYRRVQHASFVGGTNATDVPQSPTGSDVVFLRTPRDPSPQGQKVGGYGVVAIKSDGGEITDNGVLERKKIRYTYRPEQPLPGDGSNHTPRQHPLPDRLSHVIQTSPFTRIEPHSPTSPAKAGFRTGIISVPEPIRETTREGYVVQTNQGGVLRISSGGSQNRYAQHI